MDEWLNAPVYPVHMGRVHNGQVGPYTLQDLDYDWITQHTHESVESIKDRTLLTWIESTDCRKRAQAALEGGPREWGRLLHDESWMVRGYVARCGTQYYKLQLVSDPEWIVRKQCAIYGKEKVEMALIAAGEQNLEIISEIAKHGNVKVRKELVKVYWDNPEALHAIVPYAVQSDFFRLVNHPDKSVRLKTAMHGDRAIVQYIMSQDDISVWDKTMLQLRLDELQEISEALSIPFEIEAEHTPITADQAKEMIEQTVDDALSL